MNERAGEISKAFPDVWQTVVLLFAKKALIAFLHSSKVRIQFFENVPTTLFHLDVGTAWKSENRT